MNEKEAFDRMIEEVRSHRPTEAEMDAQTVSFAYGNAAMSNPLVTREMVAEAIEEQMRQRAEAKLLAAGRPVE